MAKIEIKEFLAQKTIEITNQFNISYIVEPEDILAIIKEEEFTEKKQKEDGDNHADIIIKNFILTKKITDECAGRLNKKWKIEKDILSLLKDNVRKYILNKKVLESKTLKIFEQTITNILSNYYEHGILVESITEGRHSLDSQKFLDEISSYLESVAINKFRLSKSDAEDIAQDTILTILQKIDNFYWASTFKTWCHIILVNNYLQKHRGFKAKKRGGGEKDLSLFQNISNSEDEIIIDHIKNLNTTNPEEEMIRNELYSIVSNVIDDFNKFNINEKGAAKLIFLEQMKAKQISELTSMPINKIYQITNKLKHHLRDILVFE